MRPFLALTALLLALPLAMPASEFDWMVREFSRQSGVQQLHIPFLGLARFTVAVAHPAGTSEFKLAVFEHPNVRPNDFSTLSDTLTGSSWKPMIRVRSRNGEASNIYLQPDGKHLKILIVTLDPGDATFVELRINPESLMKFVDEHKHTLSHSE
jgi:hypothetical protein